MAVPKILKDLENILLNTQWILTSVLPKFRTNFAPLCHLSKSGAQWCNFAFNYQIFILGAFLFIICSFRNAIFISVSVPNLYWVDKMWTGFFAGSKNQFSKITHPNLKHKFKSIVCLLDLVIKTIVKLHIF